VGADRSAIGVTFGLLVSLLLTGAIVYMLYHLSGGTRTETVAIAAQQPRPKLRPQPLELAQVPWAADRMQGKRSLTLSTAAVPWKPGRPGVNAPYGFSIVATAAVPRLRPRHDPKRPTPVNINLARVPRLTPRQKPAPPPATAPAATQPTTQPATAPAQQPKPQ
jgi:hypothetical protein